MIRSILIISVLGILLFTCESKELIKKKKEIPKWYKGYELFLENCIACHSNYKSKKIFSNLGGGNINQKVNNLNDILSQEIHLNNVLLKEEKSILIIKYLRSLKSGAQVQKPEDK